MNTWGLRANPFRRRGVKKEEDFKPELMVITEDLQRFTNEYAVYGCSPMDPVQEILIGDRGCGKSSSLFYIKKFIDDHCDKTKIRTAYNFGYMNEFGPKQMARLFQENVEGGWFDDMEKRKVWKFGRYDHYFIFLDFPDDYDGAAIRKTLKVISMLMYWNNIHIYIAISHDLFIKVDKVGDVFGKIANTHMKNMHLDETLEMVKKRLKYYRADSNYSDLCPFTTEAVQYIHDLCKGNPRNVLSFLSVVYEKLLLSQVDNISDVDVREILKNRDYQLDILEDRFDDRTLIDNLQSLINEIKAQFNGSIPSQKIVTEYMTAKHGWSHTTTEKRLKQLVKVGLVVMGAGENGWTKTYKLK